MQPEGPVVDWIKQLLMGLWSMLANVYETVALTMRAIEDRVARLENRLEIAFWFGIAVIVMHAVIGARSRKKS